MAETLTVPANENIAGDSVAAQPQSVPAPAPAAVTPPVDTPSAPDMDALADEAVRGVLGQRNQPTTPNMQESVALAIGANPDAEAEARRVAARTGVPVQTVFSKPEEMKRKAALDDINFDQYQTLYPASAAALSDVELAKIAHDDTENMGYLEANLRSGGRNMLAAGSMLLDAVNPYTTSESDIAALYKNDPAKMQDVLDNSPATFLSRYARQQTDKAEQILNTIPTEERGKYAALEYLTLDPSKAAYLSPTRIAGDVLNSLPSTAALALTVFLTRGAAARAESEALLSGASKEEARKIAIKQAGETMAKVGAASEGSVGYGQQVNQSREQLDSPDYTGVFERSPEYRSLIAEGFTPPAARAYLAEKASQQAGTLAGLADAVTNMVGGKYFGELLGEGGSLVRRIGGGAVTEGATEGVQSGLEQIGQNLAVQDNVDPAQSLSVGVGENIAQGVVVGGVTGGAASIGPRDVVNLMRKPYERITRGVQQATAAEQNARNFDQLNKLAAESKLKERDPLAFQNFIEQVAQADGAIADVYLDPRALAQSGISIQALEEISPSIAEQARVALEIGGDMKIPVSEYASHLAGTDLGQALVEHLKTDPMGMSRAEATEFMQGHADQLKNEVEKTIAESEADGAFTQSAEAVRTAVMDKLTAANRFTADVNNQYATLLSNFFKVQAARMGVTPEALYKSHPVDIQSVLPGGAALNQSGTEETRMAALENELPKATPARKEEIHSEMEALAAAVAARPAQVAAPFADISAKIARMTPEMRARRLASLNKKITEGVAPSTKEMYEREMLTGKLDQSAASQTETPAFKKWFGDSKVVDENGAPLVVYHGTGSDIEEFNTNGQGKTAGSGAFFTSSPAVAATYATGGAGERTIPAYLSLRNPVIVEAYGANWNNLGGDVRVTIPETINDGVEDAALLSELQGETIAPQPSRMMGYETDVADIFNLFEDDTASTDDIARWARKQGYDGVIFRGVTDRGPSGKFATSEANTPSDLYVVFRPEQVKSAIGNEGTFDPANPSILKQDADIRRGSFSPSTNTITLLEHADLSTFLHESGHFFLETMNKLALDPNAPPEIKADMQAVMDWLGVKDLEEWNSHDLEWQREKHEQFARGFESYLFEGKSPSIEMRGVFQRFRAWLSNVYRSLQALNVQLTDEVRNVFDRMLATADQIKETELARSYEPMFSEASAAGMSKDEWQQYQELGIEATQDAIAALEARSLRNMKWQANAKSRFLKDLQREAAGRRRDVREQVTKQVMAEPVNQAREFITRGRFELPEDANQELRRLATETGLGSTKLSLPALKEMYGEEANAPWRYFNTGKYGEVGTEGLHPDTVAEMFGFSSGDELIRSLLSSENAKEKIAALTDLRMLELYGDLTDAQTLDRAADEAVHNELRTRFVATEMNALQRATGGRKILTSAAKAFAENIVSRLRVRDIQPSRYAAAEARAARDAMESFKAGGLVAAAVAKRNQLIQNYAARAAHAALAEVEKALRFFKKFEREGSRENIDAEYLAQIDALLERFDLRKGQSLKAIDRRSSLAEWKAAQLEIGIEPEIPPELLNEATRKSYKNMTLEEIRGLRDTVKQIEHLGRLKNRLLTAKDNRDFKTTVDGLVTSITANSGGRVVDNRTRANKLGQALLMFKGFVAQHRKIASLARELDGVKDAGPMWETLIRTMNEAGDSEASQREKATKELARLVRPVLKGEKMGGKGRYFAGIDKSLNREERLTIALNMGNAGNIQRLLDGEGWTADQLRPVLDSLTKEDALFVQHIWDFFESFRPAIGAKEKRVYGKEPNWVEPSPITIAGEQLRGGYYPIKYDTRRSIAAEQHSDADLAKQQMKGAYTSATTRRSFTKERADEVKGRPILYKMDGLYNGVNEIIHDLSWHEWLIDANRLLRDRRLDGAIRNGYGADVVRQFKTAVSDIAGGEMPSGTSFEKALGDLRGGAVIAGLGFNIVNSVINLTGITNSVVRIGPKWVAMGVAKWTASPHKITAEVHEKSEFMRLRSKTMLREINEIQSLARGKSRARSVIDTMMFAPMTMTQLAVDIPSWYGAYQRALTEGHPEDRAIALADQAVLDAQSGGQVKDLAAIQRGGNFQKLFTTFYGYFNSAYNLGVERTKATDFKDPVSVLKLGADYLMLYSVPALLGGVIKVALTGNDNDTDPKKFASILANEQISYLMGLMVGVRELSGFAQTVAGVNPYVSGYGGPAGLRFLQEFYKLGTQIRQGEADEALRRSMINTLGIFFKLPATQANRTISGIEALIDGKTHNPVAIVAGPPAKK